MYVHYTILYMCMQERTCSLYINACKWIRVPKPVTEQSPIPVKGGILRYLIDERTKLKVPSKDLVFDVAFNPGVIEECTQSPVMDGMLASLILEYVEDMTDLKVLDRRNFKKVQIIICALVYVVCGTNCAMIMHGVSLLVYLYILGLIHRV